MLRPFIRTFLVLLLLLWAVPAVGFSDIATIGVAAIVMTILFQFVRPILKLLLLPVNIITLGLFSSVINIFLLWATTVIVPGFTIGTLTLFGYTIPFLGTLIIVSIMIGFLHPIVGFLI